MKLKILVILSIVAIAISLGVCAMARDNEDRTLSNSQSVFSPGYLNAAKFQAEGIIAQTEPKKEGWWSQAVNYMQSKLSNKTAEDSASMVQPELKKKAGGGESSKLAPTSSPNSAGQVTLIDSTQYNVIIRVRLRPGPGQK